MSRSDKGCAVSGEENVTAGDKGCAVCGEENVTAGDKGCAVCGEQGKVTSNQEGIYAPAPTIKPSV